MKNDLIIFLAKDLIFVIALIAAAYWFRLSNNNKKRLAGSVILGAILAMVLAKIASKLYYDPRPFVSRHLKALVSHSADNGFPSEHTTMAMVIASSVYFFNKRLGQGLLALTILVGLGRIWVNVHSPIDIVGGLVFGLAGAWAGYWLIRRYWPAGSAKQTNK